MKKWMELYLELTHRLFQRHLLRLFWVGVDRNHLILTVFSGHTSLLLVRTQVTPCNLSIWQMLTCTCHRSS